MIEHQSDSPVKLCDHVILILFYLKWRWERQIDKRQGETKIKQQVYIIIKMCSHANWNWREKKQQHSSFFSIWIYLNKMGKHLETRNTWISEWISHFNNCWKSIGMTLNAEAHTQNELILGWNKNTHFKHYAFHLTYKTRL